MAIGVMILVTLKGPMKWGASLGLVVRRGMSRVESHSILPDHVLGHRATVTVREPLHFLDVAEQGSAGFLPGPARP